MRDFVLLSRRVVEIRGEGGGVWLENTFCCENYFQEFFLKKTVESFEIYNQVHFSNIITKREREKKCRVMNMPTTQLPRQCERSLQK